jgi:hypothetical protein
MSLTATGAGRLFRRGIQRGKKLNFIMSVDVEYCRNRVLCGDLGLGLVGVMINK